MQAEDITPVRHAAALTPDAAAIAKEGKNAAVAMIVHVKDAAAVTVTTPSDASTAPICRKQHRIAKAHNPTDMTPRVPYTNKPQASVIHAKRVLQE